MKKVPFAVTVLVAASLVSPAVFAAAASGPKAKIFADFDTNKNGVIDGGEIAAVRKAFAATPKGQFVAYDINADGKLDDNEIAGIKPPGAKKDGEKKSGDKKKSTDKSEKPEKAEKTETAEKPAKP
jgi:hypothetical protein